VYSWFFIDLISAIPFDQMLITIESRSLGKFVGFTRITKLYKIVRLIRLFRLIKLAKERNNIGKYMTEELKVAIGKERLIFMMVIYFVFLHIIACLW
jgi:hypothetical protein